MCSKQIMGGGVSENNFLFSNLEKNIGQINIFLGVNLVVMLLLQQKNMETDKLLMRYKI